MDDMVKELLERVREGAGLAADCAADTARVACRKAGQMADVAKLNVQLFESNGDLNDTLRQLGQVMYDTHLGRNTPGEKVEMLLKKADEQQEKICEIKQRISDLRQSKNCPHCGGTCGKEDAFCRSCGGSLME